MGFCDPAPTQPKLLLVYFSYKGHAYRAQMSDAQGAGLPGRGTLVSDPAEAAWVVRLASEGGQEPAAAAAAAAAGGVAGRGG